MEKIKLKGMTWNHTRGLDPLVAAAEAFAQIHPIEITWDARSLNDFELFPLEELASSYDLIMIDHPHIGIAHEAGLLQPLEQLLPNELLEDQQRNSVGLSYDSYHWEGHQYALPLDAAAQVAVYRPYSLVNIPRTWKDVITLAEGHPGMVAIPFVPVHAYSSFFTLCAHLSNKPFWSDDSDLDPEIGEKALTMLIELLTIAHPLSKDWDPIMMLDHMAKEEDVIYSPLCYGYSNYARTGYAEYCLQFTDMPVTGEHTPKGSMIGGVGIALSTKCQHTPEALEFIQFVAPSQMQEGLLFQAGGQPGHLNAWLNDEVNTQTHHFFAHTLATLRLGSLRPRFAGYVEFQAQAGSLIRAFVIEGKGDKLAFIDQLNHLIKEARSHGRA